MKGVGEVLSVRLIAEIGDVRRFHNGSALVAFAGIDAPPYESGKFVGTKRNISKRGSSTLRKIGYEIMHSLKVVKPTEDSAVYDFIIKKENEGKPKRVQDCGTQQILAYLLCKSNGSLLLIPNQFDYL